MPENIRSSEVDSESLQSNSWEKRSLFVFGTSFFVALLAIAWFDRHPSSTSWYIYICVLAMAAGGIAGLLPGVINVDIKPGIRAGGALAVFVLVLWLGQNKQTAETLFQGLSTHLDTPQGDSINPSSGVIVLINSKVAACDGVTPAVLGPGLHSWKCTKNIQVIRGSGGIRIDYDALAQKDKIGVISIDPSGVWWISNDMVVPEGELAMRQDSPDHIKERIQNAQ